MEIYKLTTSLELSKKLKELGVPQKSEFYWCEYEDREEEKTFWNLKHSPNYTGNAPKSYCSAFLSDELGQMLPDYYHTYRHKSGKWECTFTDELGYKRSSDDDTEVNAKAKMLIYLIEQGHLKVEDIK